MTCCKCKKVCAWGLVIIGAALVGVDLGWWTIGGLNWYSLLILWFGIGKLGGSSCADCKASCAMPSGKKKK